MHHRLRQHPQPACRRKRHRRRGSGDRANMCSRAKAVLLRPQCRRTGQSTFPQHVGDRGHQIEHSDRHAGERAVDKCRKIRLGGKCPESLRQFCPVEHLHPSKATHHGHQIQQRGQVRHQRAQCHRNHYVEQPPENLGNRCRRTVIAGQSGIPPQTMQQEVHPPQHCR